MKVGLTTLLSALVRAYMTLSLEPEQSGSFFMPESSCWRSTAVPSRGVFVGPAASLNNGVVLRLGTAALRERWKERILTVGVRCASVSTLDGISPCESLITPEFAVVSVEPAKLELISRLVVSAKPRLPDGKSGPAV